MDKTTLAIVALLVVPFVLVGYIVLVEWSLRRFSQKTADRLRPVLWIFPAGTLLFVFLVYPALATIFRSLFDRSGENFIALNNYVRFFTDRDTLIALTNNVLWVVLWPLIAVGVGLIIAVLVDRVRYETVVKSIVFLPMAISFVAASVIWAMVYDINPNIGVLNAVVTATGGDPIAWLINWPLNTFMLIMVGVWMLTGFAMVILSAGLKGISTELLEAARVDGANEWQVFRSVIFPLLLPTVAVVSTTVVIFALKTFDVVYTMTGGQFDTEVIANRMLQELIPFREPGRAAATATILFLAIVPIMIINIRRFREQEAMR
jgi:alpha-glucoside transport system permease protein